MSETADSELSEAVQRLCEKVFEARPDAVEEIAAGLGARRFMRLRWRQSDPSRPTRAIARIEPATPQSDPIFKIAPEPPLEPLRAFLEREGLPVPARYGSDPECGIELMEDLGEESLEDLVQTLPENERISRYREACGLVVRLQSLSAEPAEIPAFERRLDAALIATKARKFLEWTLPWVQGRPATSGEREAVSEGFAWIAAQCDDAPARFSHRDFKAQNLHLRRRGEGAHELVMIDLQGAWLAPPEYDLVCLLRDSHVALGEGEVTAHLASVRDRLPDAPAEADFTRRFNLLTLTRVGKDISHYIHAARERGDERYLPFLPRAFANVVRAALQLADGPAVVTRLTDVMTAVAENHARRGPAALSRGAADVTPRGPA